MNAFLRWLLGRPEALEAAGPVAPAGPGPRPLVGGPEGDSPFVVSTPEGDPTTAVVEDRLAYEYRRGLRRGDEPSQAALDALLARADRVRVLADGLWRDEPIGVEVLAETRRRPDLEALRGALRIVEDPRTFGHCACLGGPTLELYQGGRRLAALALHHGRSIRWDGWRHDAELADDALVGWIGRLGAPADGPPPRGLEDMAQVLGRTPAQRHMLRGHSHALRGEFAQSLEELDRALTLEPGLAPARLMRAELHRVAGRPEEALADCEAALAHGLEEPGVYFNRALVREALGEPERALADLGRALELDGAEARFYHQRACLLGGLGRAAEALSDLASALRLAPDWLLPLITRGQFYLAGARPDLALADLNEAIGRFERGEEPPPDPVPADAAPADAAPVPADAAVPPRPRVPPRGLPDGMGPVDLHLLRALALERCGMAEPARRDHDRALEFGPDEARTHLARGDFHLRQDEPEAAVEDYREGIERRPDQAEGYLGLAAACRKLDRPEEALDALDDGLRWIADDWRLRCMRAELLAALDRHDRALADLEGLEVEGPPMARVLLLRGKCREETGDPAGGLADYEQAHRIDPDDLLIGNALAWRLATSPRAELRDAARAVALARKIVDRTGGQVCHFLDTLAAALAEAGRFDEAIELQRRALDDAPTVELESEYRVRLDLYEEGRPYRADD